MRHTIHPSLIAEVLYAGDLRRLAHHFHTHANSTLNWLSSGNTFHQFYMAREYSAPFDGKVWLLTDVNNFSGA